MNSLLVVIVYTLPGCHPCITSSVVPIDHHLSLEHKRKEILQQYSGKKYYEVTVTEL